MSNLYFHYKENGGDGFYASNKACKIHIVWGNAYMCVYHHVYSNGIEDTTKYEKSWLYLDDCKFSPIS